MTKLVLISDTHTKMNEIDLPSGDILIHSGDHSYRGTVNEMSKALNELAEKGKNFKYIITCCGNHDFLGEYSPQLMRLMCKDNNIIYLDHSSTQVEGLNVFGSAFTPEFCNWAYNIPRGEKLREKWEHIPDNTDVLITHGPPSGILDKCPDGFNAGCEDLLKRILQIRPKLHVFGHIHHSYGIKQFDGITFVNASICDERYMTTNKPIEIELD